MPTPRIALLQAAGAQIQSGNLGAAEAACREVLKRHRNDVDALFLLGTVELRRGSYAGAARCFEKCVKTKPTPRFLSKLGTALAAQGRFDRAIARYDQALKRDAGCAAALAGKADALDRRGQPEAAIALLQPVVAAGDEDPNIAYVYANLAVQVGRYEEAVKVASRHIHNDLPDPTARRRLHMTLAKAYDRLERYDEAFAAATQGHRAFSIPANDAALVRWTDLMIDTFTRGNLARAPRSTTVSAVPVFVVGMPRSGSTLIEQIIDAHPEANGAGELDAMPNTVAELFRALDIPQYGPELLGRLDERILGRLAGRYLGLLKRHGRTAARIVDKRLDNYEHLALIGLLLPGARVIHSRRDPLDTCVSCHLQTLAPNKHPYAAHLRSLGVKYREYDRLMAHWQATLDTPILHVRYEALVEDQERVSREIIEFCELDWDDACLAFHETGREVRTVSYDQVRRPIYGSAVGRHRHYEKHLGPLREALGDRLAG